MSPSKKPLWLHKYGLSTRASAPSWRAAFARGCRYCCIGIHVRVIFCIVICVTILFHVWYSSTLSMFSSFPVICCLLRWVCLSIVVGEGDTSQADPKKNVKKVSRFTARMSTEFGHQFSSEYLFRIFPWASSIVVEVLIINTRSGVGKISMTRTTQQKAVREAFDHETHRSWIQGDSRKC